MEKATPNLGTTYDVPGTTLDDLDKQVRQTLRDIGKTGSITMLERRLLSDLAVTNPSHGAILAKELRKHADGWVEARRFEEDLWHQQTRFCTRANLAIACLRSFADKLDGIAKSQPRQAA